jgi:UDP-glucose 4-epimerase
LKALVTGGTGFIGSHLTEALIRKGVHVRCLLRKTSDLKWLKGLPIEFVHGDCNDKPSLEKAVRGVDWVFHLAGVTKAIKEETYFEVNGLGTENLIHACLENNPRLEKFIYISSQAAAGPSRNGCNKKELDPCEPVSFYGRSKRAGEYVDDSVITTKIKSLLAADEFLKSFQISVETRKGIVELSGFVDSQKAVDKAGQIVRGVDGVKSVKNAIIVK